MKLIKRFFNLYMEKTDPIKFARKIGVKIGADCKLNGSPNWGSEPWLITIGDQSEISFDCAFITHDGAVGVIRREDRYKDVVRFGRIHVGENCFIGARSTILPGVSVGDQSIIAAGAVVNKSIPAGEVWGGGTSAFYYDDKSVRRKMSC